jgi:hypothetical protein
MVVTQTIKLFSFFLISSFSLTDSKIAFAGEPERKEVVDFSVFEGYKGVSWEDGIHGNEVKWIVRSPSHIATRYGLDLIYITCKKLPNDKLLFLPDNKTMLHSREVVVPNSNLAIQRGITSENYKFVPFVFQPFSNSGQSIPLSFAYLKNGIYNKFRQGIYVEPDTSLLLEEGLVIKDLDSLHSSVVEFEMTYDGNPGRILAVLPWSANLVSPGPSYNQEFISHITLEIEDKIFNNLSPRQFVDSFSDDGLLFPIIKLLGKEFSVWSWLSCQDYKNAYGVTMWISQNKQIGRNVILVTSHEDNLLVVFDSLGSSSAAHESARKNILYLTEKFGCPEVNNSKVGTAFVWCTVKGNISIVVEKIQNKMNGETFSETPLCIGDEIIAGEIKWTAKNAGVTRILTSELLEPASTTGVFVWVRFTAKNISNNPVKIEEAYPKLRQASTNRSYSTINYFEFYVDYVKAIWATAQIHDAKTLEDMAQLQSNATVLSRNTVLQPGVENEFWAIYELPTLGQGVSMSVSDGLSEKQLSKMVSLLDSEGREVTDLQYKDVNGSFSNFDLESISGGVFVVKSSPSILLAIHNKHEQEEKERIEAQLELESRENKRRDGFEDVLN